MHLYFFCTLLTHTFLGVKRTYCDCLRLGALLPRCSMVPEKEKNKIKSWGTLEKECPYVIRAIANKRSYHHELSYKQLRGPQIQAPNA